MDDGFPVAPTVPPDLPPPLPSPALVPPRPRGNYLLRHWRGELPLWQAYWINLGAVGALLRVLDAPLLQFLIGVQRPMSRILLLLVIGLFLGLMLVWQMVGVWRSASRRDDGWAVLAKVIVVVNILAALYIATIYAGAIGKLVHLDSALSRFDDYTVTASADGGAIDVKGFIGLGITEKVTQALATHPHAKLLRIDSPGGSVEEGFALQDLLKGRSDLAIEASGVCASACTIAFIGADSRLLAPGGRLGFHHFREMFNGSEPSGELDKDEEKVRARLRELGASADFVTLAFTYSGDHLYLPDMVASMQNGIVTGLMVDNHPAKRGEWVTATHLAELGADPKTAPLVATAGRIRTWMPDIYAKWIADNETAATKTTQEARRDAYADTIWWMLDRVRERAIKTGSDDGIVAYARVRIGILTLLRDRLSPLQCGKSLLGESFELGDYRREYFELNDRSFLALQSGLPRTALSASEWRAARLTLATARAGLPEVASTGKRLDHAQYATICERGMTTLRRLVALPPAEGGAALRAYL
ncbi:MAG TPA: ATP-dependent Clp protease proteolytic subunit [Luteibacter sp.]|jgi:hypothetical protein|nr:ATP-dependent Clp protease proteolytic subunit [Luteibacter sp.]